ncbi:MAG: DUF2250 domain-containing protein [Bacillota bacterium]
MHLFNSKYLSDKEILDRANQLLNQRNQIQAKLSQPNISTDPEQMPQLAQELNYLNQICPAITELQEYLADLEEIKKLKQDQTDNEVEALYNEYQTLVQESAQHLYQLLIEEGYLEEEVEDKIDLEILEYIERMGAEYAAMLSSKIQLELEETRRRLELLTAKDFLEKVEGTMLDNYHRQKDWTKHMNHTYYQLARKGELYLRSLRSDSQEIDRILAKYD